MYRNERLHWLLTDFKPGSGISKQLSGSWQSTSCSSVSLSFVSWKMDQDLSLFSFPVSFFCELKDKVVKFSIHPDFQCALVQPHRTGFSTRIWWRSILKRWRRLSRYQIQENLSFHGMQLGQQGTSTYPFSVALHSRPLTCLNGSRILIKIIMKIIIHIVKMINNQQVPDMWKWFTDEGGFVEKLYEEDWSSSSTSSSSSPSSSSPSSSTSLSTSSTSSS